MSDNYPTSPFEQGDRNTPRNTASGNGATNSANAPAAHPEANPAPAQAEASTHAPVQDSAGAYGPSAGAYNPQPKASPSTPPAYAPAQGHASPYAPQPYPAGAQAGAYGYEQGAYPGVAPYAAGAAQYGEPPLAQPWYGIGFTDAMKRFFTKYAVFSGRASRGEYWWAFLGTILIGFVAGIISPIPVMGKILGTALQVAIIVPSISVAVRRLHDTNLSGWFYLLPLALQAVAAIIGMAGVMPLLIESGGNSAAFDAMTEEEVMNLILPVLGGLGIAFLIGTIGFIISIVLLARKSNPAGARFDA